MSGDIISRTLSTSTKLSSEKRFEYYNTGDDGATVIFNYGGTPDIGQSFTIGNVGANKDFTLFKIRVKLCREIDTDSVLVNFSIKNVDGSGLPVGANLSTGSINIDDLPYSDEGLEAIWFNIFMTSCSLFSSTKYALLAMYEGTGVPKWNIDPSSPTYTGGNYLYPNPFTGAWTNGLGSDMMFEVWGIPAIPFTMSFTGTGTINFL